VEQGSQFTGSFSSDCPIEVNGRIEGELTAPTLVVSATGAIRGRASVTRLWSEGELAGDFDADVVQLSGRVKHNTVIRATSLEVKLTPQDGRMQVTFRECKRQIGDEQPPKDAEVGPISEPPRRGEDSGGSERDTYGAK
jgi:hypothetical protein